MPEIQLGVIEAQFADLIWVHAPVTTSALVKLCAEKFGWKRTTTHTVIKRLCDKGLFRNDGGTVTACLTREEYAAAQSHKFVDDAFRGSLPAFLAAFTGGRKLTQDEADAIRALIDRAEEP